MAKLSEVLERGFAGRKIRKANWLAKYYVTFNIRLGWVFGDESEYVFCPADWKCDDWEFYSEPATDEEIAAYFQQQADSASESKLAWVAYRECAEIVRTRKITEGL